MNVILSKFLKNKFYYLLLLVLLILAFYIRVYRISSVLGFYFDQGRDALVISDLISNGKWFLIGPTTGIAGIFRGPLYYYLITPAYLLGQGNPVYPSVFLSITSVFAILLGAHLVYKIAGKAGAVIFIILGGFSFYIVLASRWLSNPTPMLLLSMLLVWGMFLVTEGKKWAWILISLVAGISLFHFGSSGEFFYFPALIVFLLWQIGVFRRKLNLPSFWIILSSVIAFLTTAAPLIFFDLRHDRILTNNISEFLFSKQSFKTSFWEVLNTRFDFYYSVFSSKIFETRKTREIILMLIPTITLFLNLPKLIKNKYFVTLSILFLSPIIGLLFFQGNEGNIYDYYLTGYYLIFLMIASVALSYFWNNNIGRVFLVLFFTVFLYTNLNLSISRFNDGGDGVNTIIFSNQRKALDWIFADSRGEEFNQDVYVPPVIPYAYDYLFRWYTDGLGKGGLTQKQVSLLYTLYEEDPPHPERLKAWMDRQKGIGRVIYEQKFGGITVQRRERIK